MKLKFEIQAYIFFCFAILQIGNALAKDLVDQYECQGRHWKYIYRFLTTTIEKCWIANIVTDPLPDVPGAEKVTEPKFTDHEMTECWRSMARVQVSGARCCMRTKGIYYADDVPLCESGLPAFKGGECVKAADGYVWKINRIESGKYVAEGWQTNNGWGNETPLPTGVLERKGYLKILCPQRK